MTLEKFVANDRIFVRKKNGGEAWICIKKDKKRYKIEYAAYVSYVKYKELESKVSAYKNNLDKDDVLDIIDEAKEENYGLQGGYVFFFSLNEDGMYEMKTRQISKIEEIKQK